PVDCAGYLGTDNRRDHCGVCRGDNSTCVRFHSTFWRRPRNSLNSDGRKDRHYDYNEIFSIPAGAMHVVVSEASDTNFLALADQKSNYLVNGNWRVQSPGRVLAQGSEFVYNRTWDGREQLASEGPTTLPLTVLVLGSGDIPTVHYEYWISATNSRSLPQYPFIAKKSPESLTEYPYQTQTHQSSENTIDDSSHNHFLPPAKFQGYKSYYHRNEVLKSVPSWSIKRRKTYNKHPASRMSIPSKTDAHSEKWRNRTHDNLRHFEITVKPSFQMKESTTKTGGIHYNATTVLFSNRRTNPETTTQYIYDVRRLDGTSAFTRNNYVYPDYRETAKRKPLDNSINVKSKNGNNSKKNRTDLNRKAKKWITHALKENENLIMVIVCLAQNQNAQLRISAKVISFYERLCWLQKDNNKVAALNWKFCGLSRITFLFCHENTSGRWTIANAQNFALAKNIF
ncbi:NTR domain-containing protein, partial [Caerostris darwini]